MPSGQVFDEFKRGSLHSGSKHGPKVRNKKQAVAIYLSERRKEGKPTKGAKGRKGGRGRKTR